MALFLPVILCISLIDAFCFSGDYGTLSRLITFSSTITAVSKNVIILNCIALCAAIFLPVLFYLVNLRSLLNGFVSVILIAESAIVVIHGFQINSAYADYKKNIASEVVNASSVSPVFHLSKTGKNVIVFMLDRAENAYVEPIFKSIPALYEQFDGFTLYRNTMSYNGHTLLGAPPLFGGYEYTPKEINKRNKERLVDKQNQSLLMLPRIFTEQSDFTAVMTDSSWANYSWIPEMSICKPYPKITGLNLERKYSSLWVKQNPDKVKPDLTSSTIKRNLVWFSLFKSVPVFMRDSIYDDGAWWSSDVQTGDVMEYIDYYSALSYMNQLTDFTSSSNTFCSITNETTHSGQQLQEPDFTPAVTVKNTNLDPVFKYSNIHSNIAAYKVLGNWLDYLKKNDCYDNTRII